MRIAYSMPSPTSIGIAGGSWLTADGGAACCDGKPARRARLNSAGAAQVTLTFPAAFKPGLIGVLGLRGVAAGVIISATTGAGAALGGNAASQPVVRFADGTYGAWIMTGDTVSTATVRITIAAAGVIDIGEIFAAPMVEVDGEKSWADELVDPTEPVRTRGAQVASIQRTPYRRLSGTLASENAAIVRGGGMANGMDWDVLRSAMAGDRRCAIAPRWRTSAGAVDAIELNKTARYGVGRFGQTGHLGGDQYGASLVHEEIPAG